MLSSTVIIREGGTYEAFTTPQIWPAVLFVCAFSFLFTCARLKEMIKSAFFWGSLVPVGKGVFVWFLTHRYLAFTRYTGQERHLISGQTDACSDTGPHGRSDCNQSQTLSISGHRRPYPNQDLVLQFSLRYGSLQGGVI